MDHKSTTKRHSKTTFLNSVDNIKYIELVHSGGDYFEPLKEIIDKTEREIHLQTYIFENDETGNRIAACLKEDAKRKIKVYVLWNPYCSASLPGSFIHD